MVPYQNNVNQSVLKQFFIHNLDIYGSIPNKLKLPNIELITIFGNRLSCQIPKTFFICQSFN